MADSGKNETAFIPKEAVDQQFAEDIKEGLSKSQKSIPCVYFYDARGSELFELICSLPEYYPTRTEASILRNCADEMAAFFNDINIIELGSGSSVKTRILIDAFIKQNGETTYRPIDVSKSILQQSAENLEGIFSDLNVIPFTGFYEDGLQNSISEENEQDLILWLGSSIGNLERCSFFLIGIDLRKDKKILEDAYNDSQGITADFNKNLLSRINAELGADFNLDYFDHSAVYNEEQGRIEMRLVCSKDHQIYINTLDEEFSFAAGESIHTENSYKYSLEEIDNLARGVGFNLDKQWIDDDNLFSLNLFSIKSN